MADLKPANTLISFYELQVKYRTNQGYIIIDEDSKIKRFIIEIIRELLQTNIQLSFLAPLLKQSVIKAIQLIFSCEEKLKLKYSDNSFLVLYCTLEIGMMHFQNIHSTRQNDLRII